MMSSILYGFAMVKIITFGIIILLSLIYCLPILIIRRFRHCSNILTLNLCLTFMCCCIYWLFYCISWDYYDKDLSLEKPCAFQIYAQTMCNCQLAFAFVMIPINRFFRIIYYKKFFFKTKSWLILCTTSQWIAGFILPLPLISEQNSVRYSKYHY
jgi:hypothetical protein